jgi:hypothetical protein
MSINNTAADLSGTLDQFKEARQAQEQPEAKILQFERFRPYTSVARLNDAMLIGESTPEYEAMLDRPITILRGKHSKLTTWPVKHVTMRKMINGISGKGFSLHRTTAQKGGWCFVNAEFTGTARKLDAVSKLHGIGLDYDSGTSRKAVEARIEELGIAAILYTSYTDQKTVSNVLRSTFLKKMTHVEGEPTNDDLREYLRDHASSVYTEDHLISVDIMDANHATDDGFAIQYRHDPLDKFRIILPFSESVGAEDIHRQLQTRKEIWANKVLGAGYLLLGGHPDLACKDLNRVFYLPEHPEGANPAIKIFQGKPLAYEDVPVKEISEYEARYKKKHASGNVDGLTMPDGTPWTVWAAQCGDRLQLADLIENQFPDMVRNNKGGLLEIVCPNEDFHSTPGGTGTHISNADGAGGGFGFGCKHSCSDDRLVLLNDLVTANPDFDQSWLWENEEDGGYLLPAGEEIEAKETPTNAPASEFEDPKVWLPKRYTLRGGTIYAKSEDDDSPVPICAAFNVVGRSSNEDGTAGAGRIISFVNENGKTVERTISRADIVADGVAVLRDLADSGLLIFGRGKRASDRLLDLLNEITPQRQIPTVNVPGWVRDEHGDVAGFMHPTGGYDRVSGPPCRLLEGSRVEVVKTKGTLEGWTAAAVEALGYADSNFYWPLGLVSGFAGPLLGILDWLPCGFSLSGMTSKGKTMALVMGTTVWTTPAAGRGLLFTGNTTGNAVEDRAARGSNSLLAMDELAAMADKRALAGIMFGFSTGRTKSRKSGRDRGLAEGDSFGPFGLFSSERGMRNEIIAAGGDYRGGLAVRIPDIDVSAGVDISEAALARLNAFSVNYGHAGPIYIRHLVATGVTADSAQLEKEVLAIASGLAHGRGSAMARAARVFAVVQRGGELAADADLLGDRVAAKASVRSAVQAAWDTFTQSDEAGAATGGEALLDDLRSFLFGELNRSIIIVDDQVDVSDDHAYARGSVLGWADANVIYLDSAKVQDPKALGLDIGSRNELLKQLGGLGVLIEPDGKGKTFRQLPKELSEGNEKGAQVRNIRLCRKAMGI